MDFTPNEDHQAIAEGVATVCRTFDDEYWAACDEEHRFPWEFYARMAEGGWLGIAIPEEYGGAGRGITEAAILLHEVAVSGAAMNGCSALHLTIFGLEPIVKFGSDELKQEVLPRAAAGELHVAFGVTEPDAGTDTSRITTRADRTEDGWRVSGRKVWTSKALESEVALLLARTEQDPAQRFGGMSLFLVDLDPEHVQIRAIPKLGRNAVASCEVVYDGLPVPSSRLVGVEGEGFKQLFSGLTPERILIAAEAIGTGRVALKRAVRYAQEREVFGRPIGANQAIAHPLADAYAKLEAAWQLVMLAAWRYDNGLDAAAQANTAKYLAGVAGFEACDRALQTHGGMGYAREYHVERYWRESRLMRIVPISQEMTLNYLAQQVLGLPRSY